MTIKTITMFGAGRFGAKALTNVVAVPNLGRRPLQILLACLYGVIAWCSLHPSDASLTTSSKASAACLTVTAVVLTKDFVNGRV
jgi:hypothetical protein